ncbi:MULTISPECIES: DUF4810 domain-containing protein [unclassified Carboxylicivirga]|uniref:DUF4810 domain-containing protein n=1 Tax=Carboxylicivirga TaxID=1628153 RepID=UPI003D32EA20
MNKVLLALSLIAVVASCAPSRLYYWGQYDQATYQHNKKQTEETKADLLLVFEDIIENKHKGTRGEVPPGVYADYGYMLIMDGQIGKGKEMLDKELALYPESKKIVEYILNKI